jgi:hypothetical protein
MSNKLFKDTAAYKAARAAKKQQIARKRQQKKLQAAENMRLLQEHLNAEQTPLLARNTITTDVATHPNAARMVLLRRLTKTGLNPNAPAPQKPLKATASLKAALTKAFKALKPKPMDKELTEPLLAHSSAAKVSDCIVVVKAAAGSDAGAANTVQVKLKKAFQRSRALVGSCFAAPAVVL